MPPQYPKRLITWLNKDGQVDRRETGAISTSKVRLVEKKDWKNGRPDGAKVQYVTLSHCWGKPQHGGRDSGIILSPSLVDEMKQGIPTERLRRTFREAIQFASRLDDVGYIWIDSLCILQGPDNGGDWLAQSVEMDQVYGCSYLNLSATAAPSDDDGIFFERQHKLLWEDEINLDTANIPAPSTSLASSMPDLRRCLLLDAGFWDEAVEDAPVNKRGWVLQERVMAPRVLHFCKDQIAWECREFEAAEAYPFRLSMYRLRSNNIIDRSRMRDLTEGEGEFLRQARLRRGGIDPDIHLAPRIYRFELWKHVVELYSQTAITNPEDKLVALSGIAREMAIKLGVGGKPARYVAGLWRPYLASQLLWRVETEFDDHNRLFWHRSTRPRKDVYRAPSFSWASVDAHEGKGIVYGEVTDQGIYVGIKGCNVRPVSGDQMYGMVAKGGGIQLEGKLRQVTLFLFNGSTDEPTPSEVSHATGRDVCTGHVGWRLTGRCGDGEVRKKLTAEEHANVYLDCFNMDRNAIIGSLRTYCLPVAKGDRIHCEDYLVCLLLSAVDDEGGGNGDHPHPRGTFRRIGLTKLSSWGDKFTYQHLFDVCDGDANLPCQHYNESTGKHTIRIV